MDVSNDTHLALLGNDKNLTLNKIEGDKFEKLWQKRPNPTRKMAPDHLKVAFDQQG